MNDTPVVNGIPAGARFAFNGILTSKRVCQEFLREFGIKRDWTQVRLVEMQAMLRRVEHYKMFQAAQRLCERSGDEFIPELYMVGPGDKEDEDQAPEAPPPRVPKAKPAPTPAPQAPPEPQADLAPPQAPDLPQAEKEDDARPVDVPPVDAPQVDDVQAKPAKPAKPKTDAKAKPAKPVTEPEVAKPAKPEPVQHKEFDKLLKSCAARMRDGHRLNIWLYGPPGTGKTTAARNAAQALGLPFATTGSLLTKYDITGFISAVGKLVRSPFRDIWENGGVFLLDEIDGSDPRAIVAFNAALANAVMAFPDKMVERHKDCVMIAAANTAGMGATAEFNGRVKLDQASMDRFVVLAWPIDEAIERACATDLVWLDTVQRVRMNVAIRGVKGICISPRATFYGCALLEAGLPMDTVKDMVLKKGMSAEQWSMVQ